MKTAVLNSLLSVSALFLVCACVSPTDSSLSSSEVAPSPSPSPGSPTASEASPLVLKISSIYDQTTTEYPLTFAETNSTTCEATSASPSVTCNVSVPEGRLFYSSLKFYFSWRNDKCKLMLFQPYYYLASQSAGFVSSWNDTATDCTKVPTPADCYGGAAPFIVPEFGKYTGFIYLSDPTSSTPTQDDITLPSAYSKKYGSNRLTANDLPVAKQGNNYTSMTLGDGDSYVASTFTNYTWSCKDDWLDPVTYQITLILTDEDSQSDPQTNDKKTWTHVP